LCRRGAQGSRNAIPELAQFIQRIAVGHAG
jgi:hypothetical protein